MSSELSLRVDSAANESPPSADDRQPPLDSKPSKQINKKSATHSPSPKHLPKDLPQGPTAPQDTGPPLPLEKPPQDDDGWDPLWDPTAQAFYFYNRFTHATQWDNPRVPSAITAVAPGLGTYDRIPSSTVPAGSAAAAQAPPPRPYGGYDPAIHGDYDPTAPYAQEADAAQVGGGDVDALAPGASAALIAAGGADPAAIYTATGAFNRFTGKWQASDIGPENHNDENKSKRQMSAFFDVDAAANSHNGKSLKAERSGKKLTKQELKAFKEKRKEKKEERRRAWLRD